MTDTQVENQRNLTLADSSPIILKKIHPVWKDLPAQAVPILLRKDSIYAFVTALEETIWYNPDLANLIVCDDSKLALQIAAITYGCLPGVDLSVSAVYNFLIDLHSKGTLPKLYDDDVVEVIHSLGFMELSEFKLEYM